MVQRPGPPGARLQAVSVRPEKLAGGQGQAGSRHRVRRRHRRRDPRRAERAVQRRVPGRASGRELCRLRPGQAGGLPHRRDDLELCRLSDQAGAEEGGGQQEGDPHQGEAAQARGPRSQAAVLAPRRRQRHARRGNL